MSSNKSEVVKCEKFTNKYVPHKHMEHSSHLKSRPPGREKLLENVQVIMTIELGILITDKSFSSSNNISLLVCPYVVFLTARNRLFTKELLTNFFEEF